jgi:hypothetical protein
VEPGDEVALADALRLALIDRALVDRLVRAGDTRAEDFSMMTLARRYAEIYRAVAPAADAAKPMSPWPLSPRLRRRNRMMA